MTPWRNAATSGRPGISSMLVSDQRCGTNEVHLLVRLKTRFPGCYRRQKTSDAATLKVFHSCYTNPQVHHASDRIVRLSANEIVSST